MSRTKTDRIGPGSEWELSNLEQLIGEIAALRTTIMTLEDAATAQIGGVSPVNRASARNLLHYLALRDHDLRSLQESLAALGLSSLGRSEAHVLATLDAVLRILSSLTGKAWYPPDAPVPSVDYTQGKALLERHALALLGPHPAHRSARIMVTMPSQAADDYTLVRDLVRNGMNCMRVNCAHDDPGAWKHMVDNLHRAEQELGTVCRIMMDLPGPKLRTGSLKPGPQVVKWRPQRDALGRVVAPAHIWLTSDSTQGAPPAPADACLPVDKAWLARLTTGERITFVDTRDARRTLRVEEQGPHGWWAVCARTAYVTAGLTLRRRPPHAHNKQNHSHDSTTIGALPAITPPLRLHRGEILVLTRAPSPGRPATLDEQGHLIAPATISCTLPEVFLHVRPGERVWLDDGKIGGVIRAVTSEEMHVEITHARPGGETLGADKGINLPDSALHLPALTEHDKDALRFVAEHANLIGLSFVQDPAAIDEVRDLLAVLGKPDLGIVLKIETKRAFERLPDLLLAVMQCPIAGVMIARGDLAVECGFERLAELQQEILCLCEAAHLPVVWATQVLESMAQQGAPSRAEISDAVMGERAECIMLNKGPYIVQTVGVLNDILTRMQAHQYKGTARLRQLQLARRFTRQARASDPPIPVRGTVPVIAPSTPDST